MPNSSANAFQDRSQSRGQTRQTQVRVIKPSRPLLRLTRPHEGEFFWINKGKDGSLQTAWQMARLVREDTVRDEGLQRFAAELLIKAGLDSHSNKRDVIKVLFDFVQRIPYIHDPAGSFDAVSSARQTLAKGMGDCDDLAVLLATLMSLLGLQPRFVLARYKQATKGYDHIYVDLELPEGRIALDPTSRTHGMGWESPNAVERLTFPIFASPVTSLGDAMQLATTGAAIGLNFVPVVGPILASLVGPISSLFNRQQQRSEEAARDTYKDQVLQGMESIKRAVDNCQITRAEGQAAARQLISEFYKACDGFTKSSVAKSCRNFEIQDVPGGAQEGNFNTYQARIAAAGGNCAGGSIASPGAAVAGVSGSGGTSGAANVLSTGPGSLGASISSNLPMILLIAGGAYIAWKYLN